MLSYMGISFILLIWLFSKIIHGEILILDIIIFSFLILIILEPFYTFIKQSSYSFKSLKNNEEILQKELRIYFR